MTNVRFHPHALARMAERGATVSEVTATIIDGEPFAARFERTGFRRNFPTVSEWQGKTYAAKQVEAYAVKDGPDWLVITVIVRYFTAWKAD